MARGVRQMVCSLSMARSMGAGTRKHPIENFGLAVFRCPRLFMEYFPESESDMSISADILNPYAKYLNGLDPLAVLPATAGRLKALAQKIGAERITASPAPGKWSPRDILCHLTDCEIAFGFRLRQTLAEEHHVLQPFDQEKWATAYPSIDANEALATFSLLRRWNVLLIEGALPEQAEHPVTHPERGTMTFSTIVATMAGHDLNHLGQLEAAAAAGRP
jgi:uncharacterized damage-inducible protein DinB